MVCRDQLRHSLELRTQSKQALEEMRMELEHLTCQIAAGRSPSCNAQEASDTAGIPLHACLLQDAPSKEGLQLVDAQLLVLNLHSMVA